MARAPRGSRLSGVKPSNSRSPTPSVTGAICNHSSSSGPAARYQTVDAPPTITISPSPAPPRRNDQCIRPASRYSSQGFRGLAAAASSPECVPERKVRWGVTSPIYQSKVLSGCPESPMTRQSCPNGSSRHRRESFEPTRRPIITAGRTPRDVPGVAVEWRTVCPSSGPRGRCRDHLDHRPSHPGFLIARNRPRDSC